MFLGHNSQIRVFLQVVVPVTSPTNQLHGKITKVHDTNSMHGSWQITRLLIIEFRSRNFMYHLRETFGH